MNKLLLATTMVVSLLAATPAWAGKADKAEISHMMVTPKDDGTTVSVRIGRDFIWTDDALTAQILMDAYVAGKPVSAVFHDETKKIGQIFVHKS